MELNDKLQVKSEEIKQLSSVNENKNQTCLFATIKDKTHFRRKQHRHRWPLAAQVEENGEHLFEEGCVLVFQELKEARWVGSDLGMTVLCKREICNNTEARHAYERFFLAFAQRKEVVNRSLEEKKETDKWYNDWKQLSGNILN